MSDDRLDLFESADGPEVHRPGTFQLDGPARAKRRHHRVRIIACVDETAARIGPPPAQILETEIDGEISLYDPHSDSVLVLNQTASDVWRLSDGEQTLEEIVELLAAAYQVRPDDIRRDVEGAVGNIIEKGFLPQ